MKKIAEHCRQYEIKCLNFQAKAYVDHRGGGADSSRETRFPEVEWLAGEKPISRYQPAP
jgi:hypothetical protein